MASGSPVVNGDLSHPSHNMSHAEETIQQMNILIKENRELKEALKQTNLTMKERFEGLSVWKEKQKEEKSFLESRLEEAKDRVRTLEMENEMQRKPRTQSSEEGEAGGVQAKMEALMSQIARLQAEKNDLVALNSELQLKTNQEKEEDSFIEIRFADGEMNVTKDLSDAQKDLAPSSMMKSDMTASRLESEELTVSQLLQSLRQETQMKEQLQLQLQAATKRISELELKEVGADSGTQTSLPCISSEEEEAQSKSVQELTSKAASEVENLKAQMMKLYIDLQQAQSKLDEAENMKRNLQDRCKDLEQDLLTLRTQLGERQQLQAEVEQLKVQLESMQAANKLVQKKAQEDQDNLTQLKDAYTKLFEDYNELQQENKKQGSMSREEFGDLQTRLDAAEKALADKQEKIDGMKQELFEKEKEMETISLYQAQAEVYSSDFYAERAAREKIHEEKERLAAQLEFIKKQNMQLQDEMESMGRQSISEMQRRHVPRGTNSDSPRHLQATRGNIPEHACPKCSEVLPDLDSLQIHIMDCII